MTVCCSSFLKVLGKLEVGSKVKMHLVFGRKWRRTGFGKKSEHMFRARAGV